MMMMMIRRVEVALTEVTKHHFTRERTTERERERERQLGGETERNNRIQKVALPRLHDNVIRL